jgi:hypothetical protein
MTTTTKTTATATIYNAIRRIERNAGAPVMLPELRAEVGLPVAEFDAAFQQAAASDQINVVWQDYGLTKHVPGKHVILAGRLSIVAASRRGFA